ncbi:hypothetical protein DCS_00276 [Drechmeria coniospora]|uniref:Uncharacterized protein n=1 Tax=Drechmeria coniospora TaxID=98403 RepID=A0A151GPX3_DRECN|nr:hypothetical protein DCS_00276 [Drechmeria coniospora]KYK59146.1 hypothetical protein DCS_00276 [Drechmeria coniospora]
MTADGMVSTLTISRTMNDATGGTMDDTTTDAITDSDTNHHGRRTRGERCDHGRQTISTSADGCFQVQASPLVIGSSLDGVTCCTTRSGGEREFVMLTTGLPFGMALRQFAFYREQFTEFTPPPPTITVVLFRGPAYPVPRCTLGAIPRESWCIRAGGNLRLRTFDRRHAPLRFTRARHDRCGTDVAVARRERIGQWLCRKADALVRERVGIDRNELLTRSHQQARSSPFASTPRRIAPSPSPPPPAPG